MAIQKIAFSVCLFMLSVVVNACPPQGYTNEQLLLIRQNGFNIEDADQRNELAIALLGCVAEPNPKIRDGVAFEGLSKWLRAESLNRDTIDTLYAGLVGQLRSSDDTNGFEQPFAALILSEVARTDRVDSTFSEDRRAELVAVAAQYLASVTDYRGFSETEGWRHGVAHGSDLVLQLALNDNIRGGQIRTLMDAAGAQVAPSGEIFYTYGEPARLARAVFYAHQRGELDTAAWESWFEELASPAPFDTWSAMYASQAGLAKRHNTLSFLMAIHLNAVAAENEQATELANIAMEALRRVLGG